MWYLRAHTKTLINLDQIDSISVHHCTDGSYQVEGWRDDMGLIALYSGELERCEVFLAQLVRALTASNNMVGIANWLRDTDGVEVTTKNFGDAYVAGFYGVGENDLAQNSLATSSATELLPIGVTLLVNRYNQSSPMHILETTLDRSSKGPLCRNGGLKLKNWTEQVVITSDVQAVDVCETCRKVAKKNGLTLQWKKSIFDK